MKQKLLFGLVTLLAALCLTVPAFAQEQSLADLLGTTPEFSMLSAAVEAADPAVLELLSNPDVSLTVFAPTDEAFAALQETLGDDAYNAMLSDPDELAALLTYHVVDNVALSGDDEPEGPTAEELVEGLQQIGGSYAVPSVNGQLITLSLIDSRRIQLNTATIVADRVEAANGVYFAIDGVLVPETRTIADILAETAEAEQDADFTLLLGAIRRSDPAVLELLSDPDAELTVFAPNDAAFEALGEDALAAAIADPAALTGILQNHIVPGERLAFLVIFQQLFDVEDGLSYDTALEGQTLAVTFNQEAAGLDDAMLFGEAEARVVTRDINAANGVIHVIDTVLLPESES